MEWRREEAPTAHVFSLNGAHLHVLSCLAGLVRCVMTCGRGEPAFITKLTLIEDGSEAGVQLPYALAFDLHCELERVAFKRRLQVCSPTPQAAAMALSYEMGRLHGSLRRSDRVVILCFDEVVEHEMRRRPGVTVINPSVLRATAAFWRDRELQLMQDDFEFDVQPAAVTSLLPAALRPPDQPPAAGYASADPRLLPDEPLAADEQPPDVVAALVARAVAAVIARNVVVGGG